LGGRIGNIPSTSSSRDGISSSFHVPTTTCFSRSSLLHSIDSEVAALIEKGAIEEVPLHPPPLSFISNIFLVQKKNGKMRPVINLKKLNVAI
jgi:hypothetical protein